MEFERKNKKHQEGSKKRNLICIKNGSEEKKERWLDWVPVE